jgi:hypothetical protein
MKKKLAIVNFILMLSVLLTVSYQSLHVVLHHKHKKTEIAVSKNVKTTISDLDIENEICYSCDFKFASFLAPKFFRFTFFRPLKEIPYVFNSNESFCSLFIHSFHLRGPPSLV